MNEQYLSQMKARKETHELFPSRERKQLLKDYTKLLTRIYSINQSPLHRKITGDIQTTMQKYGYSIENPTIVVRRNRGLFDELLDRVDSDTDEEGENVHNSDQDN